MTVTNAATANTTDTRTDREILVSIEYLVKYLKSVSENKAYPEDGNSGHITNDSINFALIYRAVTDHAFMTSEYKRLSSTDYSRKSYPDTKAELSYQGIVLDLYQAFGHITRYPPYQTGV